MKWISVEDQTPNKDLIIVANAHTKDVWQAFYDGEYFYNSWNPYARIYEHLSVGVTHWQYYPEPPEEE